MLLLTVRPAFLTRGVLPMLGGGRAVLLTPPGIFGNNQSTKREGGECEWTMWS
nr:MAG TPA: hypothetical protein [Caudoviricetes sp.]